MSLLHGDKGGGFAPTRGPRGKVNQVFPLIFYKNLEVYHWVYTYI